MMSSTWNRLRTVLLLLVILFPLTIAPAPGFAASQATSASDDDLIARTVLELSRLRQRGNGNELYDWLSDMSRERLPRAAFVTWAESDRAFQPTIDPDIRGIARGRWRWPVTGSTYPDVATIELTQTGTLAGVELQQRTTWHLVFDASAHRWRWLFGDSTAQLTAIAAQPVTALAFTSAFDDETYADIDRFWARTFAELDRPYQPVLSVVAVESTPLVTGCGTESDIDSAGIYTCLPDETIYYSPGLRDSIVDQFGEVGWQTVIAHEWSHQIQSQFGILFGLDPELDGGYYIREIESQADCMTGVLVQDFAGRDLLTRADLQRVRQVFGRYGDIGAIAWDAATAHGSGADRVAAFDNGYHNGFVGCGLDLDQEAA